MIFVWMTGIFGTGIINNLGEILFLIKNNKF